MKLQGWCLVLLLLCILEFLILSHITHNLNALVQLWKIGSLLYRTLGRLSPGINNPYFQLLFSRNSHDEEPDSVDSKVGVT